MRKVEIKGYIVFDEEELNHGDDIIGQIDHELFNADGIIEWELKEVNDVEIEHIRED
ncbi:UNVERIFIED_CONTAM: hypothetical protein ABIC26_002661 [Paenibacillus sp. PvR008]